MEKLQRKSYLILLILFQGKYNLSTSFRREFWGEGVAGLFDLVRTQSVLVRKALVKSDFPEYPTIKGGHYTLIFPDKTNFVPNSPYYFFQIPEQEIVNNPAVNGPLLRN